MGLEPAGDLVGGNRQLEPIAGPFDPASGACVLEREALDRQVVGLVDVDHRVLLGSAVLAEDRVHRRGGGRRPAREEAWALERIARERAEADHTSSSSSSSATVSTRDTGQSGMPAALAAAMNSSMAISTAASLVGASTTICAP